MLDLFDLKGKTALVTGCKRGIGMAMAVALAEAGANIIGVSASLEKSGSDVEKAVTALGRTFKAYQCDFADRKALYAFIEQLKKDDVKLIDCQVYTRHLESLGARMIQRKEFLQILKNHL